jgi:hypothetical protein
MDCVAYFTQSHIQTDKEIEMKVGCTLPQSGALASPENLVRVAKRAEELGYDSVWVFERLLWPTNPRDPYPPSRDGSWPTSFQNVFDPIETLRSSPRRRATFGWERARWFCHTTNQANSRGVWRLSTCCRRGGWKSAAAWVGRAMSSRLSARLSSDAARARMKCSKP